MGEEKATNHTEPKAVQIGDTEAGGSVTCWIECLRAGDSVAAQPVWDRYFRKLVDLTRARFPLLRKAGSIADEEDAALSAFNIICTGLVDGRYPDLCDRDDLWRLLVVITARKAINQIERLSRQRRGGGFLVRESDLESRVTEQQSQGLDQLLGPDPTPEFIAQMNEECQILMDLLVDDPVLKLSDIATWKLEGFTRDEIAARLGCSRRTVASRLNLIRKTWESHI